MKPGCMIKPITPTGRLSTKEELVEWCNNLARAHGIWNDNPKAGPVYNCTMQNFGR